MKVKASVFTYPVLAMLGELNWKLDLGWQSHGEKKWSAFQRSLEDACDDSYKGEH